MNKLTVIGNTNGGPAALHAIGLKDRGFVSVFVSDRNLHGGGAGNFGATEIGCFGSIGSTLIVAGRGSRNVCIAIQ